MFTTDMKTYGTTERPKAPYPYRSIYCKNISFMIYTPRVYLYVKCCSHRRERGK